MPDDKPPYLIFLVNGNSIAKTIKDIKAKFPTFLTTWGPVIEAALELDPKHRLVDEMLAAMEKKPESQRIGVRWYRWLVALKRGEQMKVPPVEALADILMTGRLQSGIEWLPSLGAKLAPHLNALRDRYIFAATFNRQPRVALKYLGILDRITLSAKNKKRPVMSSK